MVNVLEFVFVICYSVFFITFTLGFCIITYKLLIKDD
jgi:hypothetical protein